MRGRRQWSVGQAGFDGGAVGRSFQSVRTGAKMSMTTAPAGPTDA
jgi:hypothetical protein